MKTALTGALLGLCGSALAGPSGLNSIPTADVLKHREFVLGYCVSGTERNVSKGYAHANYATLGLFDRLEAGYDNDFAGATSLHAKVLLLEDDRRLPGVGLAAGVCNVVGRNSESYVAARFDAQAARAHLGWWRTGGVSRAFVGVDFAVLGDGTAMLEHISGGNGYSWAGVSVPIKGLPGLSLCVGVGYPNTRADGIQHYGMIQYGCRL